MFALKTFLRYLIYLALSTFLDICIYVNEYWQFILNELFSFLFKFACKIFSQHDIKVSTHD